MMNEQQLKKIIAMSMYAGCQLAEQNYAGEISNKDHKPYVTSLMKLKALVNKFATDNNLSTIDLEEIFPLHHEIETVLNLEA